MGDLAQSRSPFSPRPIAREPERTTSRIALRSRAPMKASSFAPSPVTSMMYVDWVTSRMRPPEDVGDPLDLFARAAGHPHLDQHDLALDVRVPGDVEELDHVDKLVQLLRDLLDDLVGTRGDEGHPGPSLVLSVGATDSDSML